MILVVDDEPGIREFLSALLKSQGFVVVTASSAEDALDKWDEHQPEIKAVVTDIVMPGMDGQALGERLRSERPDLPIFYMSGYLPEEIAEEKLQGPFFKKPFNPLELSEALARALAG